MSNELIFLKTIKIHDNIFAITLPMTVKIAKVMLCKHKYICYHFSFDKSYSLNASLDFNKWRVNK